MLYRYRLGYRNNFKKNKFRKKNNIKNLFYEYKVLDKEREESLNLISFEDFKKLI